jgi:hypothetical protein
MIGRLCKPAALLAVMFTLGACATPPPAQAVNVAKPICTLAGLVSGIAGKLCSVASHAGSVLKAGKKLLGGHLGGALGALTGAGTAAKALTAGAVIASLVVWVSGGAKAVLNATASVISTTTRPQLQSTWFSSTYWRMSAISALLTLPFLFAAAIQAMMRSDLGMLARSALGYLPLGLLAVSIAAPVTTLLLASSDELSSIVSSASDNAAARFLTNVGFASVGLSHLSGSTFVLLFAGLLTVAATLTLWIELLIRSAAVYVVVLMLPLFFAALVWPARRVWAVRAVELLVALIVSKFAIVAVLSLGASALGHTTFPSVAQMLEGATLVMLAAFSPWALLRLLPLHELTSSLDGLRSRPQLLASTDARAQEATEIAQALVRQLPAESTPSADATPDEPRPTDVASRPVEPDLGRNERGSGPEVADDADTEAHRDGEGSTQPAPAKAARSSRVSDSEPGARRGEMEPIWQAPNFSWEEISISGGELPLLEPPTDDGAGRADPAPPDDGAGPVDPAPPDDGGGAAEPAPPGDEL